MCWPVTGWPVIATTRTCDWWRKVRRGADGVERTRTFGYDALGNMVSVDGSGRPVRQSFNEAGQLVRRTVGSGAEVEQTAFVYDVAGNLIRLVSPEGLSTYSWTADGRLAAMARPDGVRVEFVYDGTGKRQSKTVFAPDGSVSVTKYSWDAGRLAWVERDGLVARFGYDPEGAPLSMQVGEAVYAFRTDVRGSTLELTDTATHEAALSYRYDARGSVVDRGADSPLQADLRALNPFTFVGTYGVLSDEETGLAQMGVRSYDSRLSRFISRDPAEFEPDASSYVYAAGNPLVLMDPAGLWPRFLGKAARSFKKAVTKVSRVARSVGRTVYSAARKVGHTAWKYKYDIALTAAMFVPGVNVIAGAARVVRAAQLAKKAWSASKAVRGSKKLDRTSKVARVAKKSRYSSSVKSSFGRIKDATTKWRSSVSKKREFKSNVALGRQAHAKFERRVLRQGGYKGQYRKRGNLRGRPDGHRADGSPLELKPYNTRALKRGERQLQKYENIFSKRGELWAYHQTRIFRRIKFTRIR